LNKTLLAPQHKHKPHPSPCISLSIFFRFVVAIVFSFSSPIEYFFLLHSFFCFCVTTNKDPKKKRMCIVSWETKISETNIYMFPVIRKEEYDEIVAEFGAESARYSAAQEYTALMYSNVVGKSEEKVSGNDGVCMLVGIVIANGTQDQIFVFGSTDRNPYAHSLKKQTIQKKKRAATVGNVLFVGSQCQLTILV
jgi:hypothetical protein